MKIACIGGGPAGLYFAISMKLRDPVARDRGVRAQPAGRDLRLGRRLLRPDGREPDGQRPVSGQDHRRRIRPLGRHRRPLPRRDASRSSGHGFIGIGRKRLLEILQDRARELGVGCTSRPSAIPPIRSGATTTSSSPPTASTRASATPTPTPSASTSTCAPTSSSGSARRKVFDAFTFAFEETEHGWIWAHAYRFAPDCSTFIVECSEATWRGLGFDRMDQAEAIALCEKLFAKYLDGHALQSNAAHLRRLGGLAQLPPHQVRALARTATSSCSATPRTPRISRSARAPSSRSRMRSSWPRCSTARACSLEAALDEYQRRAEPRGAQAAEQRAQLDRMVRDARALSRISSRCNSLIRC